MSSSTLKIILDTNNNNNNNEETTINNNNNDIDKKYERDLRELTKTFFGIEKPLKNLTLNSNTLNDIIDELHNIFSKDIINIEHVNHLLLNYKSNPNEWKKFAKFDRYRYTRNLVDAGNGKFNLMILCWGEGHGSAIHDHSDSHCFMKVLKGELAEVRYAWPNDCTNENISNNVDIGSTINNGNDDNEENYINTELKEIGRHKLELNGVCYINDHLGLHRVENPSNTNVAVSLHLYCPPFNTCSVFNKKTGQRSKCQVTFWSKFGEHRDKQILEKAIPEDN